MQSTNYVTVSLDHEEYTNGKSSFKLVSTESYKNSQFTISPILANTTYILSIDLKVNKDCNLTIIERNPAGDRNSIVTIPASNDWKTYTITHTTTTNPTKFNFFVNPRAANTIIYIDNIHLKIQ